MAESEAPPPSSSSSSGPSPIVIAIVVLLVALGGGYGLFQFVFLPQLIGAISKASAANSDSGGSAAPAPKAAAPAAGGEGGEKKGGDSGKEFVLNDLLVNLSGGNRYVKCTLVFEADPAVLSDLNEKRAKISDIVQQTIASKKFEELTASDSRGKLRTELLATINPLLDAKGEVTNIYFQEFIIQ